MMEKRVARGANAWLAKLGALSLSVGVVGFMMLRAGGLGCSGSSDAGKDPVVASASSTPATETSAALVPSASGSAKKEFIGGSKAWSDDDLIETATKPTTPTPTVRPVDSGVYFPGTKAAPFPRAQPNAPKQQGAQ